MYRTELGAAACFAVVDEGLSRHEAARRNGIDRWTVADALLNGEIFCSFKEARDHVILGVTFPRRIASRSSNIIF